MPGNVIRRIAGVVLIGCLALVLPAVLPNNYVLYVATIVLSYATLGYGLAVVYGCAGQVSIGQAGFFAIGAYTSTLLALRGVDFVIALGAGLVACAVAGALLAMVSLRLRGFGLAIVTFGFAVIVYTLILALADLTGGINGLSVPPFTIMGRPLSATTGAYYIALGGGLVFAVLTSIINGSFVGRNLLAVKSNELVAQVLGIRVQHYRVASFAYSASAAGVAGSIFVLASGYIAAPAFDPLLSVTFFAMVVIGGSRSVWGVTAGAALIVLLPSLLNSTREISMAVLGAVMIAAMVFAEDGLAGVCDNAYRLLMARDEGA